jgi:hypothetical protein
MRMTVKTEQLLQDGGATVCVYHDRTAWSCAVFFVGGGGAKDIAAKDIHKEMLHMYDEHCLSRHASF